MSFDARADHRNGGTGCGLGVAHAERPAVQVVTPAAPSAVTAEGCSCGRSFLWDVDRVLRYPDP